MTNWKRRAIYARQPLCGRPAWWSLLMALSVLSHMSRPLGIQSHFLALFRLSMRRAAISATCCFLPSRTQLMHRHLVAFFSLIAARLKLGIRLLDIAAAIDDCCHPLVTHASNCQNRCKIERRTYLRFEYCRGLGFDDWM